MVVRLIRGTARYLMRGLTQSPVQNCLPFKLTKTKDGNMTRLNELTKQTKSVAYPGILFGGRGGGGSTNSVEDRENGGYKNRPEDD